MSAYFQNTLLPGAKASDVGEAIKQWHISEGYTHVTNRLLFDCRYTDMEVRAFVISNEQWCVILHSNDVGRSSRIRRALNRFPAVVQLWAKGGGWGYRLYECGKLITSYCSKGKLESHGDASARQRNNLERLAFVCGVDSIRKLRRVEMRCYLFNTKPCSEFGDALNVPIAALSFHDVDVANAGITEERLIAGWNCQMLCFTRMHDASAKCERNDHDVITALTEADHTAIARWQRKARWLGYLMSPFVFIVSLVTIPIVAILAVSALVGAIPSVRRGFSGKAVTFRDDFVKQLRALQPKRVLVDGDVVTNTRHGCSISVRPPAKPCRDLLPRKGGEHDELVFDISLGNETMSCMAYPRDCEPRWSGVEVLEKRSFLIPELEVQFEKRRTTNTKPRWFQYEWNLRTAAVCYRFFYSGGKELPSEQRDAFEQIVRSFKPSPSGRPSGQVM